MGFLFAPISFELTHTWLTDIEYLTPQAVAAAVQSLYEPASRTVRGSAPDEPLTVNLTARMRYAAQGHEIEAEIQRDLMPAAREFRNAFETRYPRAVWTIDPRRSDPSGLSGAAGYRLAPL